MVGSYDLLIEISYPRQGATLNMLESFHIVLFASLYTRARSDSALLARNSIIFNIGSVVRGPSQIQNEESLLCQPVVSSPCTAGVLEARKSFFTAETSKNDIISL